MAKKSSRKKVVRGALPPEDQVFKAAKPSVVDKLMGIVKAAKRHAKEHGTDATKAIAKGVKNDGIHRKAFTAAVVIDTMKPLARAEFLFHLDTYRAQRKWDQPDLLNGQDRPQTDAAKKATAANDDKTKDKTGEDGGEGGDRPPAVH